MNDKVSKDQGYGIWDTNIDGKRIMGFTPQQWFDREVQHAAAIESLEWEVQNAKDWRQKFHDMDFQINEQKVAIERKDALLRQALDAFNTDDWMKKHQASVAITKELQ